MQLIHESWTQAKGRTKEVFDLDTSRTDLEIRWKDGTVCKQSSPFEHVTADWNCDGDVYTEFGANFDSKYGAGRAWYAPVDLLSIALKEGAVVTGLIKLY